MSKKTKITIAVTAIAAVTLILALKYWKTGSLLPVTNPKGGAGSLGTDVPLSTPQAITEAAYNQAPNSMDDAIDDPNALDEGVLTLA
jgi:hypothetical protein